MAERGDYIEMEDFPVEENIDDGYDGDIVYDEYVGGGTQETPYDDQLPEISNDDLAHYENLSAVRDFYIEVGTQDIKQIKMLI